MTGASKDGESPFDRLKKLAPRNRRDRVSTDLEIRAIWLACTGIKLFGHAIRLLLATGQRRSSSAISNGVRSKGVSGRSPPNGRSQAARIVTVAAGALDPCRRLQLGAHVFTTRSTPKGETIPISGWSKSKARLDALAIEALRKLIDDDEADDSCLASSRPTENC